MPDLRFYAGVLGYGQGLAEGGQLFIGFRPVGFVGDGQVGKDSHHPQQPFILIFVGFANQLVPGIDGGAVPAQAGVHLQVDPCRALLLPGGCDDPVQLPA